MHSRAPQSTFVTQCSYCNGQTFYVGSIWTHFPHKSSFIMGYWQAYILKYATKVWVKEELALLFKPPTSSSDLLLWIFYFYGSFKYTSPAFFGLRFSVKGTVSSFTHIYLLLPPFTVCIFGLASLIAMR